LHRTVKGVNLVGRKSWRPFLFLLVRSFSRSSV